MSDKRSDGTPVNTDEDRFIPTNDMTVGSIFDTKYGRSISTLTHKENGRVWWFDDNDKRWVTPDNWQNRNL